MSSEALFPRGPVSRSPAKKIEFKKRNLDGEKLFKVKKIFTKKKNDSTNTSKNVENLVQLFQTVPDRITNLRYKSVTEGLVIAGRIREINISRLGIFLPGRVLAHACINKISTPYSSQLLSLSDNKVKREDVATLEDMFQIGELVTVAVDSVNQTDGKYNISVSLNPSDVNKTFDSSTLVENVVLVGAIESIEDHGYVVNLGINNVVAFLPNKNVDKTDNEGLVIGKVVRTVVVKVIRKSSKTTVTLSLKKGTFLSAVPETGFSNTNILPGTRVKVSVIKVLPYGLIVKPLKASDQVIGHVSLNNLPSSCDSTNRFKPGMVLPATLLYTIPHANIMYFNLWPQLHDPNPQRQFLDGALVKNAKVVAMTTDGTYFELRSGELTAKGLVSQSQAGGKDDFKVGDEHTVRIIHYDLMENIYICTMKPEILSFEIYSANDVQVGQVVEGKVIKVMPRKGVILRVGNITVFAPQFHLTDFPEMSQEDNVLSPLCKLNAVVKAKVLSKNEDNCLVTLKPILVKTPALCSYSDAKPGSCFYGTVKSVIDKGVIVWFYNNITGFIPNREINPITLKDTIHVGQSIRCYVTGVDPNSAKLFLSMTPEIVNKGYNFGSVYPLTVIESVSEGLKVEISNTSISGFLPFHQLSDYVTLLQPLRDHYQPGSKIEAAVAYSSDESSAPLFSLRSSVRSFFELNTDVTTSNLNNQKDGATVPCSIIEIVENGINVDICIPNSKHHFIAKEDIVGYDEKILSVLSVNQAVMAVSSVQKDEFKLQLNKNKFYDISEVGFGIDLLLDYLKSSKLMQSINIGEKTQATISKIKNKTVRIKLSASKLKGTISRKLCKGAVEENDSIAVKLLWQSPLTKEVHALPIEKQTDVEEEPTNVPKVGKSVLAEVVLVENDFAIGRISEGPLKSQIAFFPVRSHLNDLSPTKLQLFSTVHLIPVLLENDYIVAIDKAKLDKYSQRTGKKLKEVLSQLVKNVDTFFNNRKTPVFLNVDDITPNKVAKKKKASLSNGDFDSQHECSSEKKKRKSSISEQNLDEEQSLSLLSNGGDSTTSKKSKKKKASLLNGDVDSQHECSSGKKKRKSSISEQNLDEEQSLSLLSNEDDSTTNKKAKKKKASLLNGDVDSQHECSSGKKKRKSSISEQNLDEKQSLSLSTADDSTTTKVAKKKKASLSNGDVDSQPECSSGKKKKKSSLSKQNAPTEDDHSKQDGLKSRLSLQGYEGFSWSVDAKDFSITQGDNDDDSEDEDDETVDNSGKKGRSQMTVSEKRAAAKESEQRLRRAEQLLLEAESNPQSVDHFERLVLAHPNSSMLWIKYMAMHLQETEIDKARAVAKRALQVMNSREEEERLNVWTALLNLENLYGSEESLKSELAEAVRTNDEYQVYSKMLEIYADSKKTKSVEQLAALMSKKFNSKLECWLLCCRNLMRVGSLEKARSFFQRGLEALTKKHHVQFITRFALLENALGSFDHAQTVMDHVLMTYPGRIPAWTTYVDMLTKSGHIDLARQVLQRSINQKLPVKKMKTLYKKWLDFEQQHGTQSNITLVKNLAEQYVNSLSLKIDDIK